MTSLIQVTVQRVSRELPQKTKDILILEKSPQSSKGYRIYWWWCFLKHSKKVQKSIFLGGRQVNA